MAMNLKDKSIMTTFASSLLSGRDLQLSFWNPFLPSAIPTQVRPTNLSGVRYKPSPKNFQISLDSNPVSLTYSNVFFPRVVSELLYYKTIRDEFKGYIMNCMPTLPYCDHQGF